MLTSTLLLKYATSKLNSPEVCEIDCKAEYSHLCPQTELGNTQKGYIKYSMLRIQCFKGQTKWCPQRLRFLRKFQRYLQKVQNFNKLRNIMRELYR